MRIAHYGSKLLFEARLLGRSGDNHGVRWSSPQRLLVFGGLVLTLSAVTVVLHLGVASLWTPIAHEAEGRSLLTVALFPGHGLRELPHVLILAMFWLEGRIGRIELRQLAPIALRLAGTVVALTLVLFVWAAAEAGWASAWLDLSQGRAAEGLLGPGRHFRFNLLSDIALAGLFFCAGRLSRETRSQRGGAPWFAVTGGVALLSLVVVWGWAEVGTPRFIGHQAREIFTHTLVTLPLLAGLTGRSALRVRHLREGSVALGFAIAAGLSGWLAWSVLHVDILSYGANPELPMLVNLSVHNWEHLIDLVLLLLVSKVALGIDARADDSDDLVKS